MKKKRNWIVAPKFLWKDEGSWPKLPSDVGERVCSEHHEVKRAAVRAIIKTETPHDSYSGVERLIEYHSSWISLKRSVAWILRVRKELLRRANDRKSYEQVKPMQAVSKDSNRISLSHSILAFVQRREFTDEIDTLLTNRTVKSTSNIRKLDPVLDGELLRDGERLVESKMPENCNYPIILPKGHHVSDLILRQIHIN